VFAIFDATHLQNVQPTATIRVAEIPTSQRQSPNKLQAHAHVPSHFDLFGELEIEAWIFPSRDFFYTAALLELVAVDGEAATFGLAREP